jgi:hypothetical protein
MKASERGTEKALTGLTGYMAAVACLFVGWVALLMFPWQWAVPAVAVLEVIAIMAVLGFEYSSRHVNGAGGWLTFAYLMGHLWLFAGAAVLRLLVWGWQTWVG